MKFDLDVFSSLTKEMYSFAVEIFSSLASSKDNLNEFKQMKRIFQKSIVTSCDIKKGEFICKYKIAFKKPGDGISASQYKKIIGKKLKRDIQRNVQISWGDLI